MKRWSLTGRLVFRLSVALAALWILAAATSVLVARHEFNEVADSALQEAAQRLLALALEDLGDRGADSDWSREIRQSPVVANHEEYLIYQIRAADGRVLIRSHDAPVEAFTGDLVRGLVVADGWRIHTETDAAHTLFIQVAEVRGHRIKSLSSLALALSLPLIVLIPLSAIIVRIIVRGTLSPLAGIRASIASRGGSNMKPIGRSGLPGELRPIVGDVNRLLERLRRSLEAERAFASGSAHELRTPVASALAQISRLKADLDPHPAMERVSRIEEILRNFGGVVEKLLQLSKAEAGVALKQEPVKPGYVARYLVEEFTQKAAYAGRVELRDETDAGQDGEGDIVRTDIDALAIALRNLIENALIHGAEDGTVTVLITKERSIRVINAGHIVPGEELPALTERFSRGRTRAAGSGLGLAIVRMIVEQIGGTLEFHSPAISRPDGFEAVIRFP